MTDRKVASLKPLPQQTDYFDEATRGFGLRVSPGGTKAWFLKYVVAGDQRRDRLGEYPAISLAGARKKALALRSKLADGMDPRAERAAAAAEQKSNRENSFSAVAAKFITRHASKNRRGWEVEQIINRELVPYWGERPIAEISRQDVVAALDRVVDRGAPIAANRLLAVIRKLFGWAIERGILDATPVANISAPSKESARDRVLDDDEIKTLWQGCDKLVHPFGAFTRLLLLTAQRRGELAQLNWTDLDGLDGDSPTWTLPRTTTKADRTHAVPLSPQAAAIINSLPRTGEYVFSTGRRGDKPIAGFSVVKRQIDEITGLADWRYHDLRRSGASIMARLNTPPHVLSRILNHAPIRQEGVTAIYNRYHYAGEQRHALNALGQFVMGLLEKTPERVVSLSRQR